MLQQRSLNCGAAPGPGLRVTSAVMITGKFTILPSLFYRLWVLLMNLSIHQSIFVSLTEWWIYTSVCCYDSVGHKVKCVYFCTDYWTEGRCTKPPPGEPPITGRRPGGSAVLCWRGFRCVLGFLTGHLKDLLLQICVCERLNVGDAACWWDFHKDTESVLQHLLWALL